MVNKLEKLSTFEEIESFIHNEMKNINKIDPEQLTPNLIYSLLLEDYNTYSSLEPYITDSIYYKIFSLYDMQLIGNLLDNISNESSLERYIIKVFKNRNDIKDLMYTKNDHEIFQNFIYRDNKGYEVCQENHITNMGHIPINVYQLAITIIFGKKSTFRLLNESLLFFSQVAPPSGLKELTLDVLKEVVKKHPDYSPAKEILRKITE